MKIDDLTPWRLPDSVVICGVPVTLGELAFGMALIVIGAVVLLSLPTFGRLGQGLIGAIR